MCRCEVSIIFRFGSIVFQQVSHALGKQHSVSRFAGSRTSSTLMVVCLLPQEQSHELGTSKLPVRMTHTKELLTQAEFQQRKHNLGEAVKSTMCISGRSGPTSSARVGVLFRAATICTTLRLTLMSAVVENATFLVTIFLVNLVSFSHFFYKTY